jgi:hypothetical protein
MYPIRRILCWLFGHSKITVNIGSWLCCGRCENQLCYDDIKAVSIKHLNEGCTYCQGIPLTKADWMLLPLRTYLNS